MRKSEALETDKDMIEAADQVATPLHVPMP
jgi:hypothetical protein